MNKRDQEIQDEMVKRVYKIFDKLEQRITKLEKVLESHAKCIGEMRDKNGNPCYNFWDIEAEHPRTAVNYSVRKA